LTEEMKISLPLYEGPLDLLLDMIRKQKIDVYDIPIARITEQYLEYLRFIQELNIDVAGEFSDNVHILLPRRNLHGRRFISAFHHHRGPHLEHARAAGARADQSTTIFGSSPARCASSIASAAATL